ncbi:MAG: extracellular solute-binding protein [Arachnia sp.]
MRRRTFLIVPPLSAGVLGLAACGGDSDSPDKGSTGGGGKNELSLYASSPKDQYEPAVATFKKDTGIEVSVVSAGTGELINRIMAEGDNPLGDVQWGGLGQAVAVALDRFDEYVTTNDAQIIEAYRGSTNDKRVTPFSIIANSFMVNTDLAPKGSITGWQSLLDPSLKGKIAFADPAKSSSALSQIINMLHAMGGGDPEKGWDFVGQFAKNLDGKILGSSSNVYQMTADGEYAVGITNETNAVKYLDTANIEVVYPTEGNLVMADNVFLIKNAKNPDSGKKFIDFLTSKEYQDQMETVGLRTVRSDVTQKGFPPLDTLNVIEENKEWATAHAGEVKDRFLDLFTA